MPVKSYEVFKNASHDDFLLLSIVLYHNFYGFPDVGKLFWMLQEHFSPFMLNMLLGFHAQRCFIAGFIDFPNKDFSNSVALYFRKMQNNLLNLKSFPFNTFDGLRSLKEM